MGIERWRYGGENMDMVRGMMAGFDEVWEWKWMVDTLMGIGRYGIWLVRWVVGYSERNGWWCVGYEGWWAWRVENRWVWIGDGNVVVRENGYDRYGSAWAMGMGECLLEWPLVGHQNSSKEKTNSGQNFHQNIQWKPSDTQTGFHA